MEDLHKRVLAPAHAYPGISKALGGAGDAPLSSSFSPDVEYLGKSRAPNVNPSSSREHKTMKRIIIDSRNRDVVMFPNANNFVQNLPLPIRAVKSITMTDARIPLVDAAAYLYSVVCLPDLSGGDLLTAREGSQFAAGALGVIPMIPTYVGAAHTYYTAYPGQKLGGSGGGWRLEFPMGITLSQIRVQILTYTSPGNSMLLPIVDAVPANRVFASNLYITLEIEHDV